MLATSSASTLLGHLPSRLRLAKRLKDGWEPLRGFILSMDDAERLDRLIAFYRHGGMKEVVCTSKDQVVVEWFTSTADGVKEQFLDGSCIAQEDSEILPLWKLAQRAGAAGHET